MLDFIRSLGKFSYYISVVVFLISLAVVSIVLVIENFLVVLGLLITVSVIIAVYVIGYLGRWKDNPTVTDDKVIYKF